MNEMVGQTNENYFFLTINRMTERNHKREISFFIAANGDRNLRILYYLSYWQLTIVLLFDDRFQGIVSFDLLLAFLDALSFVV